jgi:hypothetical protein
MGTVRSSGASVSFYKVYEGVTFQKIILFRNKKVSARYSARVSRKFWNLSQNKYALAPAHLSNYDYVYSN